VTRRDRAVGALSSLGTRAGALLLLVLLLPLLLVVALLVRLSGPGPVLFRQVRVGQFGRPFVILKFRTMRPGSDALLADLLAAEGQELRPFFKVHHDPRITRVGRVLRKTSLDELPQLVNVLLGHMSLIGPRPALPSEVSAYDEHLLRRLAVKPGMTGLWQVSGRSDLPWRESVRLDLAYVDNWSWRMDLVIAIRTFGAVVSHRGAY
jgi:lipopolysaccharide/colanic/teichoic acid biosynthesis glycosyltransferase